MIKEFSTIVSKAEQNVRVCVCVCGVDPVVSPPLKDFFSLLVYRLLFHNSGCFPVAAAGGWSHLDSEEQAPNVSLLSTCAHLPKDAQTLHSPLPGWATGWRHGGGAVLDGGLWQSNKCNHDAGSGCSEL